MPKSELQLLFEDAARSLAPLWEKLRETEDPGAYHIDDLAWHMGKILWRNEPADRQNAANYYAMAGAWTANASTALQQTKAFMDPYYKAVSDEFNTIVAHVNDLGSVRDRWNDSGPQLFAKSFVDTLGRRLTALSNFVEHPIQETAAAIEQAAKESPLGVALGLGTLLLVGGVFTALYLVTRD